MKDFSTDLNNRKRTKSRLDIAKENRLRRGSKSYKIKGKKGLFRGRKLGKRVKKILLVLLLVIVIASVIGGVRVLAYLQDLNDNLPTPDKVFPDLPVASEIYDRKALESDGTGTTLYRIFNQYNSDPVDIKQVPDIVKWSFLAAEDSDFYTHGGFDLVALVRCGFAYVKAGGTVSCGGSTITQQLVKITALTSDPTLQRKIEELLLATKVEQLYDKDTILEMYLRVAPFGSNIYGVKTAANFYFGKEPKDLDLAQATLLAAIIQDPIRLSPTLSPDKTQIFCRLSDGLIIDSNNVNKGDDGKFYDSGNEVIQAPRVKCRQLYILNQMEVKMDQINNQTRINHNDPNLEDVLTKDEIDAARTEKLKYKDPVFDKKAGHFVDYVLDALTTRNYNNGQPFTTEDLQKGGYKIYTTLDYGIQQVAESYAAKAVDENKQFNMNNAAVMTVTPSNGEIIAMAGSRDFYGKSEGCDKDGQNCKFDPQTNIFRTLQSPGSSNKPLGFEVAYEEGKLFTGSLLPDIPVTVTDTSGVEYSPKDWNGGFLGLGSAEYMLRESRNLPAINVIQMIGVSKYLDTARKWGYTTYTDDSQYGLSVILGGADVYPDEHVQAYSVFANNGDLVKLNPILKIVDKDGNTVYEAKPERENVAKPQGVYLVNESLLNLHDLSWDGRDVAAKTGTSEDSKDAWTVEWSPDFITLAWGGNNNNDPMDQYYGYPPYVIIPWLKQYMTDIGGASYFSAKTQFTRPGFVYQGGGDCNSDGECLGIEKGWLIQDVNPPRDIIKKKFLVCSDQLDRLARPIDIAMGKSVKMKFTYYKMPVAEWQHFLDDYLKSKGISNVFPTEPCNIDRSGGVSGPFFSFTSVSGSSTSSINIKGGIYTSNSGASISSSTFVLDGKNIPSCTPSNYDSFDITCDISSLGIPDNGKYQFYANATDSKGVNNSSSTISVVIGSQTTGNLSVDIGSPIGNNYAVTAHFTGSYNLDGLTLYMIKNSGSAVSLGNMSHVGSNYVYDWNSSSYGSGKYKFYVKGNIQSSTGIVQSANSSEITVP